MNLKTRYKKQVTRYADTTKVPGIRWYWRLMPDRSLFSCSSHPTYMQKDPTFKYTPNIGIQGNKVRLYYIYEFFLYENRKMEGRFGRMCRMQNSLVSKNKGRNSWGWNDSTEKRTLALHVAEPCLIFGTTLSITRSDPCAEPKVIPEHPIFLKKLLSIICLGGEGEKCTE